MPDSAEQLQRLYVAGFELQTFDRYPNAIGVLRDGCIALLQANPGGLKTIGAPGWRLGEVLGVLVENDGRQVFQAKLETVEATPERLAASLSFAKTWNRCSQQRRDGPAGSRRTGFPRLLYIISVIGHYASCSSSQSLVSGQDIPQWTRVTHSTRTWAPYFAPARVAMLRSSVTN